MSQLNTFEAFTEHLLGKRLLRQHSARRHKRNAFLRRLIDDCRRRTTSIK